MVKKYYTSNYSQQPYVTNYAFVYFWLFPHKRFYYIFQLNLVQLLRVCQQITSVMLNRYCLLIKTLPLPAAYS